MTQQDKLIANEHRVMAILQAFSLNPSGEVNISLYNMEDDEETEYRFSNISKMIEELNINNVKVVDGKVTDLEGNPVTAFNAQKLESKSLEEVRANIDATKLGGELPQFYRNTFNRIKMLVDTEQTSFPERWMAGVTWENEIIFTGRNKSGLFIQGFGEDIQGWHTIPQNHEKNGVKIEKLFANSWTLYVLYEDGDLYFIGQGTAGQGGIGNTANQYELTFSLANVKTISTSSVGYHQDEVHVLAVLRDGTVKTCGANQVGQCGAGNTDRQLTWQTVDVPSNIIDCLAISTYNANSYLIGEDGFVYAAGYKGAIGDGGTTNHSLVFKKINNLAEYKIVKMVGTGGTRSGNSAYYRNSVHFLSDTGRKFGLGDNESGNLGVNNKTYQALPIEVHYTHDNVADSIVDIFASKGSWASAGYITASGESYIYGADNHAEQGQGDSNRGDNIVPVPLLSGVQKIYDMTGSTYCIYRTYLARMKNNIFKAWGYGSRGTVGNNKTNQESEPVDIRVNNAENVVQVSQCGYDNETSWHILFANGTREAWGNNTYQEVSPLVSSNSVNRPIRTIGA